MYNSIIIEIRMDVNGFMTQTSNMAQSVITGNLKSILPLTMVRVDRTEEEALWDEMIRTYHYLG
jgi:hypothetical protein